MAEEAQEKTEEPTGRRKNKARSEGSVARSEEVSNAFFLIATIMLFVTMGGFIMSRFRLFTAEALGNLNFDLNPSSVVTLYQSYLRRFMTLFMPFAIVALIATFMSSLLQYGWLFSTKLLKLKWDSLLNFGALSKHLFSVDALQNLAKSIIKLVVLFLVTYMTMKKDVLGFLSLVDFSVGEIFAYVARLTLKLLSNILYVYFFIALADYAYTRYKHNKDLKMSKSEVKDEYRQLEGDPQVRNKIRSMMFEESRKRMMAEVPKADVVITNPVHLAVALRYDAEVSPAPIVVAKGKRLIAEKIKEIARENDIPIVENPPLARLIYKTVEIGREIGMDLYSAVAEILAQVYQLKNRKAV
jgi:flagellar biosynthetic protein FlhB